MVISKLNITICSFKNGFTCVLPVCSIHGNDSHVGWYIYTLGIFYPIFSQIFFSGAQAIDKMTNNAQVITKMINTSPHH